MIGRVQEIKELFTHMPVGQSAVPKLMVTAGQRKFMYEQVCKFRETRPIC